MPGPPTPCGRPAVTIFRSEQVWSAHQPPLALLEAELKTGRTHQIRVHLAHIGHPIAGDDKYGDFAWNRELAREGLKRMFLHACRATFMHPATGETVEVASPVPGELTGYLQTLADDGSLRQVILPDAVIGGRPHGPS